MQAWPIKNFVKSMVALITIVVSGFSFAATIHFDDFSVSDSFTFITNDFYRSQGIVFHQNAALSNIALSKPQFLSQFVQAGGTPPNTLTLNIDNGPLFAEASFVVPDSKTPATTNFVSIQGFNTKKTPLMATLEAFDIHRKRIAKDTLVTQTNGRLEVRAQGIAFIRISTDVSGADFDNLSFNTPIAQR